MHEQQLNPITFDNMPSVVARLCELVSTVKAQLDEQKKSFEPKNPDELLTPEEVAKMLKCHITTVDNNRKKGKLKKYCLGNRVYYKRSEVEAALIAI